MMFIGIALLIIVAAALGVGLLVCTSFSVIKKLVVNLILGVLLILLFDLFGADIPINVYTLIIVALFGVGGAGTLGLLSLMGYGYL